MLVGYIPILGLCGGSANGGRRDGERYFLGFKEQYAEVSRTTFYSVSGYEILAGVVALAALISLLARGRPYDGR
jgi:hypothetical protein